MTSPPPSNLNEKAISTCKQWSVSALAVVCALAAGAGIFELTAEQGWLMIILGVTITFTFFWDVFRRFKGFEADSYCRKLEGPLLWLVFIWILYRYAAPYAPQLVIIPAGLLSWIVLSYSWRIFIFPVTALLVMETGLTFTGYQQLDQLVFNLLSYCLMTAGILFFAQSRVYRHRMRKAFHKARQREKAQALASELGLDEDTTLLGPLPQIDALDELTTFSRDTLDKVTDSFQLQLEIIRLSLDLTTVAVLWPDTRTRELRLRYLSSSRQDIDSGPYRMGSGITGAFAGDRNEIIVAPVSQGYSGLPYYRSTGGIGSILAVRLPDAAEIKGGEGRKSLAGIFCVDRQSSETWTDTEREVLSLAARKIQLDINMARNILFMDRERSSYQRICIGLRELNNAMDLKTVFQATAKSLKALVPVDMIAISLVDGDCHRTVLAHGMHAERLADMEYRREEGLVGQVIKTNSILPPGGKYHGAAPIFSRAETFDDFRSILIIPLRDGDGQPIGALTVAAVKDSIFTLGRVEILELISRQVAIKIDLGQAHETINKMATTDGLTGLNNHRTFQHAFDVMLARAQRRQGRLGLILCDIDHFKSINDNHGHPFGDQVLRGVANALSQTIRTVDLAARYGGEEFAVVLEDSDGEGTRQMAERIRGKIENLSFYDGNAPVKVTISLGATVFPDDTGDKTQLIEQADQALYEAKNRGRNRTVLHSEMDPG